MELEMSDLTLERMDLKVVSMCCSCDGLGLGDEGLGSSKTGAVPEAQCWKR